VKEIVGVPTEYTLTTLVIVGYPGDVDQLSDKHREIELGPVERRRLSEVAGIASRLTILFPRRPPRQREG
jgi:hypothetical protein